MIERKLTVKQQAFADEYIINGGNATQAAIKAGYSKKTARSQGQRLLTNVDVNNYIGERLEQLQDERILKQKDVLVMMSDIAAGRIPEMKEVITRKAEYINNPNSDSGKQTMVYNEYAEMLKLPTRNSDRIRALEAMGKFYKLWTDRQEVENVTPMFVEDVPEND